MGVCSWADSASCHCAAGPVSPPRTRSARRVSPVGDHADSRMVVSLAAAPVVISTVDD
jgi:hypothetical protein